MNANILKMQEALWAMGFDPGKRDGLDGPKTRAAAGRFAAAWGQAPASPAPAPKPPASGGMALSSAALAKMQGVDPALYGVIVAASAISAQPFTVIEGLRTRERQAQLVKIGASKTMNSRHLIGQAVDLWPLGPDGKSLPSDAAYPRGSSAAKAADRALWAGLRIIAAAVKQAAAEKKVTITWGGDWKSFPDGPHFQIEKG